MKTSFSYYILICTFVLSLAMITLVKGLKAAPADFRPLPASTAKNIELISFSVGFEEQKVKLKWSAANCEVLSHFTVERSTDQKHFKEIALVFTDESTGINNFQFNDKLSGKKKQQINYRLRMTDKTGNTKYSEQQTVQSF